MANSFQDKLDALDNFDKPSLSMKQSLFDLDKEDGVQAPDYSAGLDALDSMEPGQEAVSYEQLESTKPSLFDDSTAVPTTPEEDEESVAGLILENLKPGNLLSSTLVGGVDMAASLVQDMGVFEDADVEHFRKGIKAIAADTLPEGHDMTGLVTSTAIAGLSGAGLLAKLGASTTGAIMGGELVAGALMPSDMKNIGNLLEDWELPADIPADTALTAIKDSIGSITAYDPNDPAIVARTKNALEALVFLGIAPAAIKGFAATGKMGVEGTKFVGRTLDDLTAKADELTGGKLATGVDATIGAAKAPVRAISDGAKAVIDKADSAIAAKYEPMTNRKWYGMKEEVNRMKQGMFDELYPIGKLGTEEATDAVRWARVNLGAMSQRFEAAVEEGIPNFRPDGSMYNVPGTALRDVLKPFEGDVKAIEEFYDYLRAKHAIEREGRLRGEHAKATEQHGLEQNFAASKGKQLGKQAPKYEEPQFWKGYNRADAIKLINKVEGADPNSPMAKAMQEATETHIRSNAALMQFGVQSGVIDPKWAAQRLRSEPHFVPFKGEPDELWVTPGEKSMARDRASLWRKARSKSEKDLADPVLAWKSNVEGILESGLRNEHQRNLYDLLRNMDPEDLGKFAELDARVANPSRLGDNETFIRNVNKDISRDQPFKLSDDNSGTIIRFNNSEDGKTMQRAFEAYTPTQLNAFLRYTLRPLAKMQSKFTVYMPDFWAVAMPIRDVFVTAIQSSGGRHEGRIAAVEGKANKLKEVGKISKEILTDVKNTKGISNKLEMLETHIGQIPFASMIDEVVRTIGKDKKVWDSYKEATESGALFGSFRQESVADVLGDYITTGGLKDMADAHKSASKGLVDNYTQVATHMENMMRKRTFRTLGHIKKADGTPKYSEIQKAEMARDLSTDFGIHGSSKLIQGMAATTPFFNPAMQGMARTYKALKDPATHVKGVAYISAPTAMLWNVNKDDPSYQKLSGVMKAAFWHIPVGTHDNGETRFLMFPKPFEYGQIYGTSVEKMLDTMYSDDPITAELAADVMSGISEEIGVANPLWQSGGGIPALPAGVQTAVETMRNKKGFTGSPIVPEHMKGMADPMLQIGPGTSMAAVEMGRGLRSIPGLEGSQLTSPMQLQAGIESLFGGVGRLAMDVGGLLARLVDEDLPRKSFEAADIPIFGRFVGRSTPATESARVFHEEKESERALQLMEAYKKGNVGVPREFVKTLFDEETEKMSILGEKKRKLRRQSAQEKAKTRPFTSRLKGSPKEKKRVESMVRRKADERMEEFNKLIKKNK